MNQWREFAGRVSDMPCADGWKAIVAINTAGKVVGTYSAPDGEFDPEIEALLEARVERERQQLKLIG